MRPPGKSRLIPAYPIYLDAPHPFISFSHISGDTTAEAKPSPLPVLHACQLLNCRPGRTLYVGDDRRDIVAGNAAGCRTVAAAYGYLGDSGPALTWGAEWIIDRPADLLACVRPRAGR